MTNNKLTRGNSLNLEGHLLAELCGGEDDAPIQRLKRRKQSSCELKFCAIQNFLKIGFSRTIFHFTLQCSGPREVRANREGPVHVKRRQGVMQVT